MIRFYAGAVPSSQSNSNTQTRCGGRASASHGRFNPPPAKAQGYLRIAKANLAAQYRSYSPVDRMKR